MADLHRTIRAAYSEAVENQAHSRDAFGICVKLLSDQQPGLSNSEVRKTVAWMIAQEPAI